jgi:hypothetical protein
VRRVILCLIAALAVFSGGRVESQEKQSEKQGSSLSASVVKTETTTTVLTTTDLKKVGRLINREGKNVEAAAFLKELKPGDTVRLTTDTTGRVTETRIVREKATRQAAAPSLTAFVVTTDPEKTTTTVLTTTDLKQVGKLVNREGKEVEAADFLKDLKPSDTVHLTTDATGKVTVTRIVKEKGR